MSDLPRPLSPEESAEAELLIHRYNAGVKGWGKGTHGPILASMQGMGIRRTGAAIRSLKVSTGSQFGRVNRVSFGFLRYVVWVEKGAGRGHGGRKGSSWYTGGKMRKTDPRSFGKMNTGNRSARPSVNPIIDQRTPLLADLVAQFYADMAINTIRIK
jgi:hypothetical protein